VKILKQQLKNIKNKQKDSVNDDISENLIFITNKRSLRQNILNT
jgi:hypothetical protein